MRISDWSSDVCSSDLADPARRGDMVERAALLGGQVETASGRPRERKLAIAFGDSMASARLERCCRALKPLFGVDHRPLGKPNFAEIGRASCRARVCHDVLDSVGSDPFKKTKNI